MDHLLALLRGTPYPPADERQWRITLALAASEAVLPWLTLRVLASAPPPPPAIVETLLQAQRDFHLYAVLLTAELTSVLEAFAARGIPVLLLKGPSLAERVYGAALLRTSRDLDLLVRPGHFTAAQQLLLSIGFTANSAPDDYHQSLRRNTVTVELHYEVENPLAFNFHLASAWQQAQLTDFHGQPAWLFAPADELLYLALHAVRHRYSRLSYVLDLALAIQRFGPEPTLRPEVQPLAHLLALAKLLAHSLAPQETRVPQSRETEARGSDKSLALRHATAHTRAQADRLWVALLEQPETPLDWQSLHRFYVELEPTRYRRLARRVRHARILATRITEGDRDFAARYGLYSPWGARLLRPVRLLLERETP